MDTQATVKKINLERSSIAGAMMAILEENEETIVKNISYTDYLKAKSVTTLTTAENDYLIKYLEGEPQIEIKEELLLSIRDFTSCILGLNLALKSLQKGSHIQKLVEDTELVIPNFNTLYEKASTVSKEYFVNYSNFSMEAFETMTNNSLDLEKLVGKVVRFIRTQVSLNKIPLLHE